MTERTDEEKQMLFQSQEIAKGILSGEIDPVKGSEQIHEIYIQLHSPNELENWRYLDGGHSAEWYDRVWWFPFMQRYNHKNWLEAVNREAMELSESDFSKYKD